MSDAARESEDQERAAERSRARAGAGSLEAAALAVFSARQGEAALPESVNELSLASRGKRFDVPRSSFVRRP